MEDTAAAAGTAVVTVDRRSATTAYIVTEGWDMLNIKIVTWSLAIFTSVSYLLCVAYGLIARESLHMHQFLEIVLPGFEWLSFPGFLLGLLESFLWGAYMGLLFVPIHNTIQRRIGGAATEASGSNRRMR